MGLLLSSMCSQVSLVVWIGSWSAIHEAIRRQVVEDEGMTHKGYFQPDQVKRNRKIVSYHKRGLSAVVIGKMFGLSRARIGVIIRKSARLERIK